MFAIRSKDAVLKNSQQSRLATRSANNTLIKAIDPDTANALQALVRFNQWFAKGGPALTGMSPNKFKQLNADVTHIRALIAVASRELDDVENEWHKMLNATEVATARLRAGRLINEINEANCSIDEMMQQASNIDINANRVDAFVTAWKAQLSVERNNAQIAYDAAQRRHDQAVRDYNAAKSELEGDKGFLNGFVTGLTLGIHNPVKANMDKANRARKSAEASIASEKEQLKNIREYDAALRGCQNAIGHLRKLLTSITALQNLTNTIQTQVNDTFSALQTSEKITVDTIAERFREKAGKSLAKLFGWSDAMNKAA